MSNYQPSPNVLKLTIGGATRPLSYWAQIAGTSSWTIQKRLNRGLAPAEAVFGPDAAQMSDRTLLAIFSEAIGGAG